MNSKNKWGWKAEVKIVIRNLDGSVKDEITICNEIKNCALNAQRDLLQGVVQSLQILYMGWGNSNTANAKTQATLVAEFGRKSITAQASGSTGVVTTTTYIAPYEGNDFPIQELGWFAGTATGTLNSGLILGRVLYSHSKTNLESITVTRTDTFS